MTNAATMDIRFWAATDQGRVRQGNEDHYLIDKRLKLFMVCDGMGGHDAGDVASLMACQILHEVLAQNQDILNQYTDKPTVSQRRDVLTLLEFAVRDACARIYQYSQQEAQRRGMGTTLSLLLLCARRGFIAHVGDSRIYLLRKKQLHQLTEDHSLVNELRKRGKLTHEQLDRLPFKNAVTRAVGVHETVDVDTLDFDVLPGDRFLLCSDGLHGYFSPEGPRTLLEADNLSEIPQQSIDFANAQGGRDNITAVLVAIGQPKDKADGHTRRVERATNLLRRQPLFQSLTYKELTRVMSVLQQRKIGKGEPLIDDTQPIQRMHWILTGTINALKDQRVVKTLEPGDAFTMLALLEPLTPQLRYRAVEDSVLLSLSREDLLMLTRQDDTLGAKIHINLSRLLARRLRQAPPTFELVQAYTDAPPPQATPPAAAPPPFKRSKSASFPPPPRASRTNTPPPPPKTLSPAADIAPSASASTPPSDKTTISPPPVAPHKPAVPPPSTSSTHPPSPAAAQISLPSRHTARRGPALETMRAHPSDHPPSDEDPVLSSRSFADDHDFQRDGATTVQTQAPDPDDIDATRPHTRPTHVKGIDLHARPQASLPNLRPKHASSHALRPPRPQRPNDDPDKA